MEKIVIRNRSLSRCSYKVPELHLEIRLGPGESHFATEEEIRFMAQKPGILYLMQNTLVIEDSKLIEEFFEIPFEYYWTEEDIKNCIFKDSIEEFRDTLTFAPTGIIAIIKKMAIELPIADYSKIKAFEDILGIDIQFAIIENEKDKAAGLVAERKPGKRLRGSSIQEAVTKTTVKKPGVSSLGRLRSKKED